jgi:hypothetical protein
VPLATLKAAEWIGIAAAGVALLGVVVATVSVALGAINERRRTQPIVIAHESYSRRFAEGTPNYFAVGAHITSEGVGAAFNVRFGVEFGDNRWMGIPVGVPVRYPYRQSVTDPDSGNVERVMQARDRRPTQDGLQILIPQESLVGTPDSPDRDESRIYWARYENARGQTWERRNPWQRSARLHIRRVRVVRLREWAEHRRRVEAKATGLAWEAAALELLRRVGHEEAKRRGLPVPDDD